MPDISPTDSVPGCSQVPRTTGGAGLLPGAFPRGRRLPVAWTLITWGSVDRRVSGAVAERLPAVAAATRSGQRRIVLKMDPIATAFSLFQGAMSPVLLYQTARSTATRVLQPYT